MFLLFSLLCATRRSVESRFPPHYTLNRYQEGWDGKSKIPVRGLPVLFLPGSAGNGHQVRSLGSVAGKMEQLSARVDEMEAALAQERSDRDAAIDAAVQLAKRDAPVNTKERERERLL